MSQAVSYEKVHSIPFEALAHFLLIEKIKGEVLELFKDEGKTYRSTLENLGIPIIYDEVSLNFEVSRTFLFDEFMSFFYLLRDTLERLHKRFPVKKTLEDQRYFPSSIPKTTSYGKITLHNALFDPFCASKYFPLTAPIELSKDQLKQFVKKLDLLRRNYETRVESVSYCFFGLRKERIELPSSEAELLGIDIKNAKSEPFEPLFKPSELLSYTLTLPLWFLSVNVQFADQYLEREPLIKAHLKFGLYDLDNHAHLLVTKGEPAPTLRHGEIICETLFNFYFFLASRNHKKVLMSRNQAKRLNFAKRIWDFLHLEQTWNSLFIGFPFGFPVALADKNSFIKALLSTSSKPSQDPAHIDQPPPPRKKLILKRPLKEGA